MTRQELASAGDDLEAAADVAAGTAHADRLADLADQLHGLSTAERGPDHGRLARIQAAMHDVRDEVDGETADLIRDAHEAINGYREQLEGV